MYPSHSVLHFPSPHSVLSLQGAWAGKKTLAQISREATKAVEPEVIEQPTYTDSFDMAAGDSWDTPAEDIQAAADAAEVGAT